MINKFYESKLKQLRQNKINSPELDLKLIISKSLINNKFIFTSDVKIKDINVDTFKRLFNRRINGEPISKIFNNREFYSLDFYINKYTLDPRPETEFIVEGVKKHIKNRDRKLLFCDLGTGSGCIIITLLQYYKASYGIGVDISKKAVDVAKTNLSKYFLENRLKIINKNWKDINNKFDVIVANPPYIKSSDYNKLDIGIKKYDPKLALVSGVNGYEKIIELSRIAKKMLKKTSIFVIEIGIHQREKVEKIFYKIGLDTIDVIKDLQGIDRVLIIKKR